MKKMRMALQNLFIQEVCLMTYDPHHIYIDHTFFFPQIESLPECYRDDPLQSSGDPREEDPGERAPVLPQHSRGCRQTN